MEVRDLSEKGRRTRYVVIGIALVALVIVGALVIVASRRPRYQTDQANQLLTEIAQETQAVSTSWNRILSDVENLEPIKVTDDVSSLSAGIDYSRTAREDIRAIPNELDSIRDHHLKIDESLQAMEELQLPDWFSDYLSLMKSMLQKDRERAEKSGQLLDKVSLYYEYSEVFLEGLIAEDAMEQDLNDAVIKYLNEDYAGSRQELNEALIRNSDVQKAQLEASKMIPFAYLTRVESNRREAEDTIKKFLRALDMVDAGSWDQAESLYTEANQQYEALKAKRLYASDIMPENTDWWSHEVDSIIGEIRELTTDIEGLLSQIQTLVERNKS